MQIQKIFSSGKLLLPEESETSMNSLSWANNFHYEKVAILPVPAVYNFLRGKLFKDRNQIFCSCSGRSKEETSKVIDQWHAAAEDAIYLGIDQTQNWHKPEYNKWSRPFINHLKVWDFTRF